MKTCIFTEQIAACAEVLKKGGLLAVPTETVYGLAANGLDAAAVDKIYAVKGRPSVKPLSLMVPGPEAMDQYCDDVPDAARVLAETFWPGPLTIVLKSKELIPSIVRAGGDTIGLRCPDHPLTLAVLRESGLPLAAPSANPSGQPSPKTAQDVMRYFEGQIDAVLDGGPCGIGTESTIISLADTPYRILRQGALPAEAIADVLVEHMTIFGITGGSGSGKTTALQVLREMGALVVDADAVYHELLKSDPALLHAINARFPGTVSNGALDRKALAEAVFRDSAALEELSRLTHPAVIKETKRRLREHALSGGKLAAIDAIGLIGSGLDELCDRTFAVLADRETRLGRIMARDGLSREQAEARISAQLPDDYFVSHCSEILLNNASEEAFRYRCKTIFMEDIQHG